jgi:hypothetical protein
LGLGLGLDARDCREKKWSSLPAVSSSSSCLWHCGGALWRTLRSRATSARTCQWRVGERVEGGRVAGGRTHREQLCGVGQGEDEGQCWRWTHEEELCGECPHETEDGRVG